MLTAILVVFVLGYLAIALEHPLGINKAASALITGVLCWTLFAVGYPDITHVEHELGHHLSEISQILFFLIGAMTIVELVDIHGGFEVITSRITTKDSRKLLWIIGILTFFLSAALDNLTTSIVMVSLLTKLVSDRKTLLMFAGAVVIAANSGGAWSPIGDVTTTMLWIEGQITTQSVVLQVLVPSIVSLVVPLGILSFMMKGQIESPKAGQGKEDPTKPMEKTIVFLIGVAGLIFVPVFKIVFHLPPYMGMMLSLGVLWAVTELMDRKKQDKFKERLSASHALERIDTPSVLFFLGILLAVSVLQSSGQLHALAEYISGEPPVSPGRMKGIITGTGILSAIVDNVPLVKAAQGMFSMVDYPTDHNIWHFLAYAAGTGGSVLIIGSAAGVAVMGIAKIDFIWYLKRFSLLALAGYFAGIATYLLMFPNHWEQAGYENGATPAKEQPVDDHGGNSHGSDHGMLQVPYPGQTTIFSEDESLKPLALGVTPGQSKVFLYQ